MEQAVGLPRALVDWHSRHDALTSELDDLDTDVSGSRIYGSDYDPIYDPLFARRQQRDEGFLDLAGGSEVKQYVMNLNLMFLPVEMLTIVPSIRIEHQDQVGESLFDETRVAGTNAASLQQLLNTRERVFTDVTESLELRYTGLTSRRTRR